MDEKLRKIVYFDKETIKNILQEKHRGRRTSESIETKETANYGDLTVDGGAKIDIGMPVLARIKFAVSGKMSGKYLIQKDSSTTITSTEISEFEEIRTSFVSFINSRIRDIENSSTFFRVAAGYLTYDVDISGLLIILTSNYDTLPEMKKELGMPIFYRIDKFIHFEDFSTETTYQLVMNELNLRKSEYEAFFTKGELYDMISSRINATGENARTIKNKIQEAIEELMFLKIPKREDL